MSSSIDVSILELMASKLCHDIISPVGAVANGVEFLEEMGADAGEEATSLIAFSANQASAKLQAFRYGYGAGGADNAIKPEDIFNAFEKMIAPDGKVCQKWDPHAPIGPDERPNGLCKTIMNTFLLCLECLPKGGEISLEPVDTTHLIIKASGENANFSNDSQDALLLNTAQEELSPKLVHSYLTGVLAKHYGFSVALAEQHEGSVTFEVTIPQMAA